MLNGYWLARWYCETCGVFEAGTTGPPEDTRACPHCGGEVQFCDGCQGQTDRTLPFHTPARERQHPKYPWLADGAVKGWDKGGGNQKTGKSTGRPRKDRVVPAKRRFYTHEEIKEDTVTTPMEDNTTPRRCAYCPNPATQWRTAMDARGQKPDPSSRRPVCGDH